MNHMLIRISGIADLSHFVQAATQVDGDVIVRKGKYVVDGKSLLGMFSIDPTLGVTVEYPEDAKAFESYIETFKV